MVLYKCDKCNKQFNRKPDYVRHLKRKTLCTSDLSENDFICHICNKVFSQKSSLTRHNNTVCIENDNVSSTNEKINKLADDIETMKSHIDKIEKENEILKNNMKNTKYINNGTIVNGDNNTTNTTNTINQNIYIVAYRKEDISKLDKNEIAKIYAKGHAGAVSQVVEYIHCNDKYPENQNVLITDKNRNSASVYKGAEWILVNKDDFADDIYDDKLNILHDEYADMKTNNIVTQREQKHFEKFTASIEKDENVRSKSKKIEKEKIKNLLYSNRKKILETKIKNDATLTNSENNNSDDNVKVKKKITNVSKTIKRVTNN